jgi:putative FmdB family regulatory protein
MPLFDYKCRGCGHTYEYLLRGDAQPVCPQCSSPDAEKQLTMFSVGTPSLTPAQKEKQSLERAGWVQVGKPFKTRR